MIPMLSFFKFIAFLVCVFAVYKLSYSLKKKPRSELWQYFYKMFVVSVGVFFLFSILPLLYFLGGKEGSLRIINIITWLAIFLIFVASAYISHIVFTLTYFKKIRKIAFWMIILMGLVEVILALFQMQPALVLTYNFGDLTFITWGPSISPSSIFILNLIIIIGFTVFSAVLFFYRGASLLEHRLRIRSFMFGGTMIGFSLATLGLFGFGSLFELTFSADLIHGLGSVGSMAFLLGGIYYGQKE